MKSGLSALLLIFLFSLGCSKDNNQVGPSIKLKSYSEGVYNGGFFNAVLSYSVSGSSNLGDSLVIIQRRFNQSYIDPTTQRDTFATRVSLTQSTSKAEIQVNLDWVFVQSGIVPPENDTCNFSFVLIDQNDHHSDTVTTGTVIIYAQ